MGLFIQAEFAKICGIEQAYLTVNRKRNKVVVDENGMVDDSIPMNALFKQKCLARKKKPKIETENAVGPPHGDKPDSPEPPASKAPAKAKGKSKTVVATTSRLDERFDLDTEKRRAEINKLKRESEIAEIKHEKMVGKLMPTEVTKSLVIQTIKNYTVSFKQAADKIIQEFSKRTKMNRNDLAAMKGELIMAINHASEDAVMESKKGVVNIVREYSEAKEL